MLVIHEEAAASYPFSQLGSGDALPAMTFAPLSPSTLKFTGWISGDVALDQLKKSNLTLAALKMRARSQVSRLPARRRISLRDRRTEGDTIR